MATEIFELNLAFQRLLSDDPEKEDEADFQLGDEDEDKEDDDEDLADGDEAGKDDEEDDKEDSALE